MTDDELSDVRNLASALLKDKLGEILKLIADNPDKEKLAPKGKYYG